MKRLRFIFCLLLSLCLVLPLSACGNDDLPSRSGPGSAPESVPASLPGDESSEPIPEITTRLKVCQVDENSFLGLGDENGRQSLYSVSIANLDETGGKLAPGAVVDAVYDGVVLESWPGQIHGVKSITVVEQGEDYISLYLDILDELYETDSGLNPEGSMDVSITYGLDLSEVHNLSEGEKEVLGYLFTCSHDTDWEKAQPAGYVLGTYQDLVDEGYIDGEDLYFENGVLLAIKDEPAENGKFTFSMSKWRSGLGAVGFENCKAKKQGDSWGFEVSGEMWIS